ncbi:MAG: T9SS type A sorting domain-containing protein [Saprospiraceae bacterium]|nr:T9SS type A sorting domain-containing protein [Candidatus Opimibacter skivensis]
MKTLISRILFIFLMQCYAGTLLAHVELDNPLGGETFTVGQTVTIQWHIAIPHNTLNWDVLFSTDGGATWSFIQMDLPVGSLSYSWVVPDIITSQARVSVIQDNSGQDYQDESMNFTIQAPPMIPFIVLGAIDTIIESNIAYQNDAIQTWLDNHGGASATGFCGELIWSDNYSSLSNACGVTGSALVTFTALDECGSTETTATVTVVDTSPPSIISQGNDLIVECDGTGNLPDLVPWLVNHGGAVASDDGGNLTWSNDYSTLNNSCGSSGNATVIFTVTDECSNTSTTSATFSVEDHVSPIISIAAKDTIIECGLPNTQAILQSYLDRQGGAQASDICGNIIWTNDFPVVVDTCHASTNVSVTFNANDECGNSVTTSAIVTLMGTSGTAVSDLSESAFRVFPNPAHHTLKVVFDKNEILPTHLSLFNSFGLLILSQKITAEVIDIPVSGYPPGIYYLRAKTTKGIYTSKFVIE